MRKNPFTQSEGWTMELEADLYQEIHYRALRRATVRTFTGTFPLTIPFQQLAQVAPLYGKMSYLFPPTSLAACFAGITVAVYHCIRDLYCSRLLRSPYTVWRILAALAAEAHHPSPSYEAVWALCLHLDEERQRENQLTLQRHPTTWWMTPIRNPLSRTLFKSGEQRAIGRRACGITDIL